MITLCYTLICIPSGYITSIFANDVYKMLYNKNLSNVSTCGIITTITFITFYEIIRATT